MPSVLVVDDDRTVLRLVEKAMHERDVTLFTATSAADGLAAIRSHRPDVLLLDIQLPDSLGLDIVQQVRDIDPLLPVVYITVSDASDFVIEAMKLGAYDFLLKPLNVTHLQGVVERALETRRLMGVPVGMNEVDERTGHHLLARVSERALPGGIHAREVPVERRDALEIERDGKEPVELFFGVLAGDKQANLAADGGQHIEQFRVRLTYFAREELHDGQNGVPAHNGEPERTVQARPIGRRRPGKVGIVNDVGNPGGSRGAPDSSRQSNARGEHLCDGDRFELVKGDGR